MPAISETALATLLLTKNNYTIALSIAEVVHNSMEVEVRGNMEIEGNISSHSDVPANTGVMEGDDEMESNAGNDSESLAEGDDKVKEATSNASEEACISSVDDNGEERYKSSPSTASEGSKGDNQNLSSWSSFGTHKTSTKHDGLETTTVNEDQAKNIVLTKSEDRYISLDSSDSDKPNSRNVVVKNEANDTKKALLNAEAALEMFRRGSQKSSQSIKSSPSQKSTCSTLESNDSSHKPGDITEKDPSFSIGSTASDNPDGDASEEEQLDQMQQQLDKITVIERDAPKDRPKENPMMQVGEEDKQHHFLVTKSSSDASSEAAEDSGLSSSSEESELFESGSELDGFSTEAEVSIGNGHNKYECLSGTGSEDSNESTKDCIIVSSKDEYLSQRDTVEAVPTRETLESMEKIVSYGESNGSSTMVTEESFGDSTMEKFDSLDSYGSSIVETLSQDFEEVISSYFTGCLPHFSRACGMKEHAFSLDPRDREDWGNKPSLLVETKGKRYPADVYENRRKGIVHKLDCVGAPDKLRSPLSPKKGVPTTNTAFLESSRNRYKQALKELRTPIQEPDVNQYEVEPEQDKTSTIESQSSARESVDTGVVTVRAGVARLQALARARDKMDRAVMERQKRNPESPGFAKIKQVIKSSRTYDPSHNPWTVIEEEGVEEAVRKSKSRNRRRTRSSGDVKKKKSNRGTSDRRKSHRSRSKRRTEKKAQE